MTPPIRERFWDRLCSAKRYFQFLFIFTLTLFIIGLAMIPAIEPGTETWVILQFDLAIFGTLLLCISAILYGCRKRETKSKRVSNSES